MTNSYIYKKFEIILILNEYILITKLKINKSLLFNSFCCWNSCWSCIDWCCCIFSSIIFLFFSLLFLNINFFFLLFFLFDFNFFFLFFLNFFLIFWLFASNLLSFLLHHPICVEDIGNTESPPVTWGTKSFLWNKFSTNIKSFNYHNINKESGE